MTYAVTPFGEYVGNVIFEFFDPEYVYFVGNSLAGSFITFKYFIQTIFVLQIFPLKFYLTKFPTWTILHCPNDFFFSFAGHIFAVACKIVIERSKNKKKVRELVGNY